MNPDEIAAQAQAEKLAQKQRVAEQRGQRPQRLQKKRGAHARQPLRTEEPPKGCKYPPRAGDAADAFDRQHARRWDRAENALFSLGRDRTHLGMQDAYQVAVMELAMSRFSVPSEIAGVERFAKRERAAKVKKPWKLVDSIWKPRVKWADSKDFWDTEELERKVFDCDWARSMQCGIGRYIYRMDDKGAPDGGDDDDEVDEVVDALWEFHDLVYLIFDYYAATGASDDFTHMTMNSFMQFATDCGFVDKNSQFCKTTHFDQLFISVDSSGIGGKTDEKFNRKKALNRQEFLQCLVKISVMRYVQPGLIIDVSEATHRMLVQDIEPSLDPTIFLEANEFRTKHTYTEEVDDVLRKHEVSLRLIYERACKLRGTAASKGIANKLVSFDCWKDVSRIFTIVADDLTERDCTLAFVWSRMRVIDEQSDIGRIKLTHLSFEDFLEALCRCSVCKAWPTREEMEAAESANAGVHLLNLQRDDPVAYDKLLEERNVAWGATPRQRVSYCVEHFCSYLIAICQLGKGDAPYNGVGPLTEKEVNAFMRATEGS